MLGVFTAVSWQLDDPSLWDSLCGNVKDSHYGFWC